MSAASSAATSAPSITPYHAAYINNKAKSSRLYFFAKCTQIILLRPVTCTIVLSLHIVKMLTWVPAKTGLYKISGRHLEAATFLEREYLKTVQAVRNLLFIPALAKRAFLDMMGTRENIPDDIPPLPRSAYLAVRHHSARFEQFSSSLHGTSTFEVIRPEGISEFTAESDPTLQTVMASHFLCPNMMAINFGAPNVAAFVTEAQNSSTQTTKVDAKSLRRADMTYHPTNGKIQSGLFFVPTNLPDEALDRFKEAAQTQAGRRDITCVNTNCRVLAAAGFSIEGVAMDEVIFPTTLMEHLLFRQVSYTDLAGNRHKVHFEIMNTTGKSLEQYFDTMDMAVIGTRLRHQRRNADTDEARAARREASRALIEAEQASIAEEKAHLSQLPPPPRSANPRLRTVNISIPSVVGNAAASVWGRHPIYEIDLSEDEEATIRSYFTEFSLEHGEEETLRPFPEPNPSLATRIKKNILFSLPVIRFLRRMMMARTEPTQLNTNDLFSHMRSNEQERFNYVLFPNKLIVGRVHPGRDSPTAIRKIADWALSKHGLLSGRQNVLCAGELWYETHRGRFVLNPDSGTYRPTLKRTELVAHLAHRLFAADSNTHFVAINAH